MQSNSLTFAPAASSACTSTRSFDHDSACAARNRLMPSKISRSPPALVRQACTGVSCPSFENDSCICSCTAGAHSRTAQSDVPSSLGATSMLAVTSAVMRGTVRPLACY